MSSRLAWTVIVVAALWSAWQRWEDRPVHPADGIIAPQDPLQTDAPAVLPIHHGRWTLTPRARYDLTARVLGREPIPLLEEVLGGFPAARFNLDVKSDAAIGPTLDALRRTNAWHRVRLAAFSHRRVRLLRRAAGPAVASALSPPEVLALKLGRLRLLPSLTGSSELPPAAQVPLGSAALPVITERFVARAHRLGLQVHAWTINVPSEMTALLDQGVDAIMSDRADLLREVLVERGAWPS